MELELFEETGINSYKWKFINRGRGRERSIKENIESNIQG